MRPDPSPQKALQSTFSPTARRNPVSARLCWYPLLSVVLAFANQTGERRCLVLTSFPLIPTESSISTLTGICNFSPMNRVFISFAWISTVVYLFHITVWRWWHILCVNPLLCMVWMFSPSLWVILNCIVSGTGILNFEVVKLCVL